MEKFNFEINLLEEDVDIIENMVSNVMEDMKKYAATGKWNVSYQGVGTDPDEPNDIIQIRGATGTGSSDNFRPMPRARISRTSIFMLIIGIISYYIVIFWAHPEVVY